MPGFFTDPQGRVRPLTGKKKKGGAAATLVVGGVLAVSVAAGGAGGGGLSGLGGSGGGSSGVSSVKVRNKPDGQRAARDGKAGEAWRRMGVRELKRTLRRQAECVSVSHGRVREFLLKTPCTSLDRALFAVGDDAGNSAVVSVVWVGFRTRGDAGRFKEVMDVHGSGDIYPLGAALLGMAGVTFTGHNYGTDTKNSGKVLTVAEAETATGRLGHDALDALAEVAAHFPIPR